MKRTSITLLCILIMAALALSVIMPVYYLGYSFGYGVAHGLEHSGAACTQPATSTYDLAFNPDIDLFLEPQDTIKTNDGRSFPVVIERAVIQIPDSDTDPAPGAPAVWSAIAGILGAVTGVAVLVLFVRFVVNINKGRVFDHRNVRLLRLMGILLLAMSLLQVAQGLIDDYMLARTGFGLQGYALSTYWSIPWGSLLFGLIALLMAQVWARGLALQRDHELTI